MNSGDVLKSMLVSGLNHFFTLLAAWAVQHSLFAPTVATPENIGIMAAGAAAGLISIGMLLYRKAKANNLVKAALDAQPGTALPIVEANASALPLTGGKLK